MPVEMKQLPNLIDIKISECNLPYVPPIIWQMKQLQVVDLSRNKIHILVPEIGNLVSLRRLNLQQTNIGALPPEIAYCQELEEILLWGNTIESLPETLPDMPRLKTLALNYKSFCSVLDNYMETLLRRGQIKSEHIPVVVFELPALEILDLEGTKINNIPEMYTHNLKELHLSKNFLQSIPNTIYNLKNIQFLDMSRNLLSQLPEQIGALKTLKTLRLNNNLFHKIPAAISQLKNLEEFDISGNKIRRLPSEIKLLTKLKTLILFKNDMQSLPDEICKLTALETLDISNNSLSTLPMDFFKLTSLLDAHSYRKLCKHGLWLTNNPLVQPPPEIWRTTKIQKIFDYMKRLIITKTENLRRQKILMLGKSQSGKSSLVNALMLNKSELTDAIRDKTRVLIQHKWKTENGVEFQINDFGGYQFYRLLYPLFLDRKAIILLVFDQSSYTQGSYEVAIGQWIEMLSSHCPGAVIKLVGSKKDLREDAINPDEIHQEIQNQMAKHAYGVRESLLEIKNEMTKLTGTGTKGVRDMEILLLQRKRLEKLSAMQLRILSGIASVSSAEDIQGVRELVMDLEILAINKDMFPDAQQFIPAHWNNFKEALKQRKSTYYLLMDEVQEVAAYYEIKEKDLSHCLEHLCDIGEIIWFADVGGLADIVFHHPKAIIYNVSQLYRHDHTEFFDYSKNKILMSKGGFSEQEFEEARRSFHLNGHISRPLLYCFLFYLQLSNDEISDMMDLLPTLDICYIVPEPAIPTGSNHNLPLVVLPCYNTDDHTEALSEVWPHTLSPHEQEFRLTFSFTVVRPQWIFERLSAALQDSCERRMDWENVIYAEIQSAKCVLQKEMDGINTKSLTVTIRATSKVDIISSMQEITTVFSDILLRYPGLYVHVSRGDQNSNYIAYSECLPKQMFRM